MKDFLKARIFILYLLFLTSHCLQAQIIIDHRHIDIASIPDKWIQKAKQLTILHTGQSHGRQLPYGLQLLEQENPNYAVEIVFEGVPDTPGYLKVTRGLLKANRNWLFLADTTDFWEGDSAIENVRRTLRHYQEKHISVDVILHTWSWDFRTITAEKVHEYTEVLSSLELEFPDVHFVYMSDTNDVPYNPADRTECWGCNWLLARNIIRQYAKDNRKIFFDFGELESWSKDGTRQNFISDPLFDQPIPVMHSDWIGNYDGGEGPCHINAEGTLLKAKAFWWMLARIAGWSETAGNVDIWNLY